jgi:DNA-binding transcriptional MerR regulator
MASNRTLPLKVAGKKARKSEKTIPDKLYFRISEVSKLAELEPYVLRYWETEFKLIKPVRTKSRHRLYRRKDLDIIFEIKRLLYEDQYTIAGARKRLDRIMRHGKKEEQTVDSGETRAVLLNTLEELKSIRKLLS